MENWAKTSPSKTSRDLRSNKLNQMETSDAPKGIRRFIKNTPRHTEDPIVDKNKDFRPEDIRKAEDILRKIGVLDMMSYEAQRLRAGEDMSTAIDWDIVKDDNRVLYVAALRFDAEVVKNGKGYPIKDITGKLIWKSRIIRVILDPSDSHIGVSYVAKNDEGLLEWHSMDYAAGSNSSEKSANLKKAISDSVPFATGKIFDKRTGEDKFNLKGKSGIGRSIL